MISSVKCILLMAAGCGLAGGEKNLLDIASHFRENGVDVEVISPGPGQLVDELRKIGCKVTIISLPRKFSLSSIFKLQRYLKESSAELIHCHGTLPALYGRIANHYANRIPLVYTIHGAHYLHYPSRIKKALYTLGEKLLARWTSKFICVCQSDFEGCSRAGTIDSAKTMVLYYGIRVFTPAKFEDALAGLRQEFNIMEDSKTILHVARFHYQKGQEFLIKAMPLVLKKEGDAKFILVGDGPSFNEMKDLASRLNLPEDRVVFTGSRNDVFEMLSVSDLFVLSSRWEGLPYTVLEAMLMEKPVVATKVDGIPEAVSDGETGILVQPEDPVGLAEAMLSLLGDGAKRVKMGKAGRKVVEERFRLEQMLGQIEQVYNQLLKEKISK